MLISLKWLSDFVEFPGSLDPRELAERFTRTTAEVDGVHPVHLGARGLIAAAVERVTLIAGPKPLSHVVLDVGKGKGVDVEVITAASGLARGKTVLFAPVGASVASLGTINASSVAGRRSEGLILSGESVGITLMPQEAVFLPPTIAPGTVFAPDLFDDWVIEVDNKSITHRPDLWGHYGVAREVAAILDLPFKPYPAARAEELRNAALPEVPIHIADGNACRRYSGLILTGVPTQPASLWMQLRLGRIGLRPISALVDLTNYIMADLGQPMHAFDAGKVDRIEVDWAKEGERFRTLDGVERTLTARTLMIKSSGRSVAVAGVMGGAESEVSAVTTTLLLESANFDAATVRRAAVALGMRTDASARFEKSLDPQYTFLSILRFVRLARAEYPQLTLQSRISDCFPKPFPPIRVRVRPDRVSRAVGRAVSVEETRRLLAPLGFDVDARPGEIEVNVPPHRATNDVSIEADVIEEIARRIGYGSIAPSMPQVAVRRFEPNALHELEQRTIECFASSHRFQEVHGYVWYDAAWLKTVGLDAGPGIELRNPSAEGFHRLRQTLMPGLLFAAVRNRFHFTEFALLEVGGVFEPEKDSGREFRHLGLIAARRGKGSDEAMFNRIKAAVEEWAWERFARPVEFSKASPDGRRPWEHPHRTAAVSIDGREIGRIGVIDLAFRRSMDEHLSSWGIAWAELRLSGLEMLPSKVEPLGRIPEHPQVEVDFSVLVPASTMFETVSKQLREFTHPLMRSVRFLAAFDGPPLEPGRRSLTFRALLGDESRTLNDEDSNAFRKAFEQFVGGRGYSIRQ